MAYRMKYRRRRRRLPIKYRRRRLAPYRRRYRSRPISRYRRLRSRTGGKTYHRRVASFRAKVRRGGMLPKPVTFNRRSKRLLKLQSLEHYQTHTKLTLDPLGEFMPCQSWFVADNVTYEVGGLKTNVAPTVGNGELGGLSTTIELGTPWDMVVSRTWAPNGNFTSAQPAINGANISVDPRGWDEFKADFFHFVTPLQSVDFTWRFDPPSNNASQADNRQELVVGYLLHPAWKKKSEHTHYAATATSGPYPICAAAPGSSTAPSAYHTLLTKYAASATDADTYWLGMDYLKHSPFIRYKTVHFKHMDKAKTVRMSTGGLNAEALYREFQAQDGASSTVYLDVTNPTAMNADADVDYTKLFHVTPFVYFPPQLEVGAKAVFSFQCTVSSEVYGMAPKTPALE